MKKLSLLLLLIMVNAQGLWAQTNVTSKYIDNPNFEARFAGWENAGMTFNTSKDFSGQKGMVFMEKWVSKGSKIGSTTSIKQTLTGLPTGTYSLVASAQNIQQDKEAEQTGAFLYAGEEQTEISAYGDYRVVFTVLEGKAEIGVRTKNCTGNWLCVDNFRLFSHGIVKDSINLELQRLITEGESVVGDGVTGTQLQTAIDQAKALLTSEGDYETAARTLSHAILEYRISNATGTIPTVTTEPFVPTGVTIALGRLTVKGTSKERGFCWSTEPEPTIFDNRSTRYFANNGNIYCMEHMQPATIYYVRAYAITSGWQVAYGDVVKIATLPKGNVTTTYDNAGDEQTNYRIASAVNEVKWLYDNLANIRGFNLSVHYSPGSGAGGGTADCSYGGYMRVSQNVPYQQTGTILHETNHGVGVGTTSEWYDNSNLRAETSRGLWLGPRANQVIQFLENSKTATLTGDGTHMWPYGINGAHEDSYNPESTILYYGNVFTTHALHHDGLICSSDVGFATPAYVFQQMDNQKYFLKCEDNNNTGFLTMTDAGTLSMKPFDEENADNFAWNITYDPKTSYYIFRNVGSGRYLTYSSNSIRTAAKTTVSNSEKFHLMPARIETSIGTFSGIGYWIIKEKGRAVLQAGNGSTTSPALNFANSATNQRWLFLTEEQLEAYSKEAMTADMQRLEALIANVQKVMTTPHVSSTEEGNVESIDSELGAVIDGINTAKAGYTKQTEVATAISDIETAMLTFLEQVKVSDMAAPFDLTFFINNPGMDGTDGWSLTATNTYSCCEFYERTFDFNQTIDQKLPIGTYELRVQAFQRPGSVDDTYTDFVTNGKDNVNTIIYLKTKNQKVKNIWADAQSKSLGGSTKSKNGKYVPNNMLAASKWFAAGLYENSVFVRTTSAATMKLGIRGTVSNGSYWTIFDNFRLYYYGDYTVDYVTGIEGIEEMRHGVQGQSVYDLSGRKVLPNKKGLYIVNGKKVVKK